MRVYDATGFPLGHVEPWQIRPAWLLPEDVRKQLQAIADGYRQHVQAAVIFSLIMAEPVHG